MLALDFLGVVFAGSMLFRVEVTRVRAPMICRVVREPEGLQQRLELEKDGILATTKDLRQDRSRAMVNGMPEPAWVAFVPTNDHLSSISASPARSMSTVTCSGFSVRSNAVFTDSSTPS